MLIQYYNPYDSKTEIEERTPEEIKALFKQYAWLDNVLILRGVAVLNRPVKPYKFAKKQL